MHTTLPMSKQEAATPAEALLKKNTHTVLLTFSSSRSSKPAMPCVVTRYIWGTYTIASCYITLKLGVSWRKHKTLNASRTHEQGYRITCNANAN